jgi:hypothetical protein
MNAPVPPKSATLALVLLLLIYSFGMHWQHLSESPAGMHLWTQSDHYALARGFVENGLDFFHPQTFVYHHQYPAVFDPANQSLITAVDFPIHNYIPAVVMKLSGSNSPAIMSVYMLLISVLGLVYLFRLAYLFNRSVALSFLVVGFVACSPVFTFYQVRFIPSVPTLSTAIIGLYYALRYRSEKNFRHFLLALVFLTLSALTRMTFVLPLLAWFGYEFLFFVREREDRFRKAIAVSASISLLAAYFLYNRYLRSTYGGLFLDAFMPAGSWKDLVEIVAEITRIWKYEYITKAHYIVLLAGLALLFYRLLRQQRPLRGTIRPLWLVVFLLAGSTAFFLLMCVQFLAHDYYAIDVFFVPVIVLVCLLSAKIVPSKPTGRTIAMVFTVLAIPLMVFFNLEVQKKRIEAERWGLNTMVVRNFKDSKQLLEKLHIPKDEKLVSLDPLPRNVPFLYMNRTGYVVMRNDSTDLKAALKLPFRYYFFQNEVFLSDIYKVYPGIIGSLEVIGTDGRVTICRKTSEASPGANDLFAFLHLDEKPPVFAAKLSGDDLAKWVIIPEKAEEGNTFFVKAESDAGPVMKIYDPELLKQPRILFFRGQIKWNKKKDIQVAISLAENGELKTYRTFSLIEATGLKEEWRDFRFLYTLPATKSDTVDLSLYIWNTEHMSYLVRDVEMRLY